MHCAVTEWINRNEPSSEIRMKIQNELCSMHLAHFRELSQH